MAVTFARVFFTDRYSNDLTLEAATAERSVLQAEFGRRRGELYELTFREIDAANGIDSARLAQRETARQQELKIVLAWAMSR